MKTKFKIISMEVPMRDVQVMTFDNRPSALLTLWKAFRNRKGRYTSGDMVPAIRARRTAFSIDERHMKAFYDICNIDPPPFLRIIYPFALAYPYIMIVLCNRGMPLSMFRILNTRNSITMYRAVRLDEEICIDCYNSELRIIPRGLEIDIISEISIDQEMVWENRSTYFYPGNFGEGETEYEPPRLTPIDNAPIVQEWFLPAQDRFRFARISGDTNGIHYGAWYARMLGYKRDFAQPIRVVAQCVSFLPLLHRGRPIKLDFFLKGPVYYESMLVLRSCTMGDFQRFDLYCRGNDKPCICGRLGVV
jgi:hypothetical protein